MATSKKLTGQTLFDLTSYVADTRASLSQKQALEKAQTTQDTYGHGYEKPLAYYDHDMQSWKTYEATFLLELTLYSEKWPVSGMTQNGDLYQQHPWELRTCEKELLLWPTPTAVTRPMEGNVRMYRAKVLNGQMTEAEAEAMLGKSVWEPQGKIERWPTPVASNAWTDNLKSSQQKEGSMHSVSLGQPVQMWPTPRSNQAMASLITPDIANDPKRFRNLETMVGRREQVTGRLNPMWVEWLMGFPLEWTDLED